METLSDDPLSACLLWLASVNGAPTTRDAITDGLPMTGGRLSPSVFTRAAERVGLRTTMSRQPLARINRLLLPCVVLLGRNRACLLEAIDDDQGKVQVRLPELGMALHELALEDFQQDYAGIALYCQSIFHLDKQSVSSSSAPEQDGHWFWGVIKANRLLYRDVLVAAFFINLFALAMPLFVMNVYDRVVPNHATDTLWVLSAGILLIICGDLLLRVLRSWFVELAASRADLTLSTRIMERVLGMRLEQAPASVGSFAANIQSFESVRGFIGSMTVTALIDLPFFLLFASIIAIISWTMALPVLVGAAVIIVYALSVQSRMQRLSQTMSEASSQRNSGLIESLTAAPTLKSFNGTSRMQSRWEQATQFLSACSGKLRLLGTSVGAGASWVQQTVAVTMIIVGVYLVIDGQISQGALIAAYMLSSRAMAPISQTASLLTQYYQATASLASLEQIMDSEQERQPGKQWISRDRLRGEIEFRNVSFQYPDQTREALSNISLHIRAGERVAILGHVGSGKSTLEKLILGLYHPQSGTLLIDGVHLEQIDPAELRRSIGYVPQDIQLLSGTVYDNITLGHQQPSNDALLQAIHISGLKRLVGEHADGLSMPVGEGGSRLSGGQRQAIAVARAVVGEPGMLLLDEPTSAMDSAMEQHVGKALASFSQGRTLVLITHRTSLLSLVDRLIVMDGGRIVADGSKQAILQALESGTIKRVAP